MQKITLATLDRWALVLRRGPFNPESRPKPFPGRYPTHIAYEAEWYNEGRRHAISYLGKPTPQALRPYEEFERVRQTVGAPNLLVFENKLFEFDRGQVVWTWSLREGASSSLRLCSAYHYMSNNFGRTSFRHFAPNLHARRIGKISVWMPDDANPRAITDWKTWMMTTYGYTYEEVGKRKPPAPKPEPHYDFVNNTVYYK